MADALKGQELLVDALARNARLVEALEEIRDNQGRVCDQYELCTHVACQSSYAAWHIADVALERETADEG